MPIKSKYKSSTGFVEIQGTGVEIDSSLIVKNGMNVNRNTTFTTSLASGVSETSGSLLQLKGKKEGIHFHLGGNQYVSNNSWFDAAASEYGSWIYETDSSAFRWGFRGSSGAFDLDFAIHGTADTVITGSKDGADTNGTWGTGLSLSASNGAIGIGKKADGGLSATLDITGSNGITLAVTGSVELGGNAPGSYVLFPSVGARPANPQNGAMIYNTATNRFEVYQNGAWYYLNLTAV